MAYPDDTRISIRKRHTDDTAPTTADIIEGELAVNTNTKRLYTRDDEDNIILLCDGDFTWPRPTIKRQGGTTYTVTLEDEISCILMTDNTAITVTLPDYSGAAIPNGYIVHIHQEGTGQVTLVGGGTADLLFAVSLRTRAQYSSLSCIKTAANEWKIIGDAEL